MTFQVCCGLQVLSYNRAMRRLIFLFPFFLLVSCRRDDQIQTYRVSKETDQPSIPMAATPTMNNAPAPMGEAAKLPPGHPEIGGGAGMDMQSMREGMAPAAAADRKSTRLNSSHGNSSY